MWQNKGSLTRSAGPGGEGEGQKVRLGFPFRIGHLLAGSVQYLKDV